MVARALEMDPALVPLASDLFSQFDELGSDTDQIIDILDALNLSPTARVLDLGCGKGAACLGISSQLGLSCVGIDLYPPFVDQARQAATQAGLPATFHTGDLRQPALVDGPFDVVMMLAVGDVLGNQSQDIERARSYCRPGGYMLISDGYLVHKKTPVARGSSATVTAPQRFECWKSMVIALWTNGVSTTMVPMKRMLRFWKRRPTHWLCSIPI